MASSIFPAACPECGPSTFVEFRMEPCVAEGKGGWHGFRCVRCGGRWKTVQAAEGQHQWSEGQHVVAP